MISPVSFGSQAFFYAGRIGAGRFGMSAEAAGPAQATGMEGLTPGSGRQVKGPENYDTYECQTCKSRKYKDGSDDPGVSFKTATHIDPERAAYAIRAHEYEHVAHAKAEEARGEKEIISQSVTYKTDVCPECGRVYMSGGNTRTTYRSKPETYEAEKVQRGRFLDAKA